MANENKLNLPAIHSSKGIVKPQSDAKKISPFDLSKKLTLQHNKQLNEISG